MKKRNVIVGLIVAIALIALLFINNNLQAQQNGEDSIEKKQPNEEKAPREKSKDPWKHRSRIDEFAEGKQWLESVKKYRDEINILESELDPVRKDVRSLFQQHQKATTSEEKDQIEAKIDALMSKEDELELTIARKKKEFSEMNFKLALERMIEAEVEFRETERRIGLRHEFFGKHMPGGKGGRKRDWKRDEGPKEPPPEDPEDMKE